MFPYFSIQSAFCTISLFILFLFSSTVFGQAPCVVFPPAITPQWQAGLQSGAVPPSMMKSMLDAEQTLEWTDGAPIIHAGPGLSTVLVYKLLNDIAKTGDQIQHAIMHNSNCRDTGLPFIAPLHRVKMTPPPVFLSTYKDVMDDMKNGGSKCSSILSLYDFSTIGKSPCLSYLTYIGASVRLTRYTTVQAMIHNYNARDTLQNLAQLPHPFTGFLPSAAQPVVKFPVSYDEFMDDDTWKESDVETVLKYYGETPTGPDLRSKKYQFLEYIGATVTILRDEILHILKHNAIAAETGLPLQVLPHYMTGRLPTVKYPTVWNEVMDGTFTDADLKALLKFYDQPYQVDDDGTSPLWQLQSQVLQYIGIGL